VADIRTKNTVKDIKIFDRAADVGTHVKDAAARTKDAVESAGKGAEQTQGAGHGSPSEYATDKTATGARNVAERAAQGLRKNPVKKASENANKARENFGEAKRQVQNIKNAVKKPAADAPRKEVAKRAKEAAQRTVKKPAADAPKREMMGRAKEAAQRTASRTRQSARAAGESVRTAGESGKAAGQAARGAEKTVKTASKIVKGAAGAGRKSVKTAERTAKVTVKTTQRTARAAQRAAGAATKAAKATAQASKAAAKAAVHTAKVAAKVTAATVKAIIAATKALVSAIAAGGWIAVAVILIICMVALLVGSVFGIFFSGEDSGTGYTMPMAIREINQEYADRIKEIREGNAHDDVQMSGRRADWKEILAVYAVKVNTDLDNPAEVVTMDAQKNELLCSVFWDMNTVSHRTEGVTYTETVVTDDGEGNLVETEQEVTKTILYIALSHKTATEMAEQYGFSAEQKAQLAELLSEEYANLWGAALYGVHDGSGDIVAVAISQIGNVGGEPYWSWYGFGSRVEWCATFASWCANECGYIDAGIIPRFAACQSQGIAWFTERGLYQDSSYVPVPGDIIFFDWGNDGVSDHVGIVEYVEGETVHTVEGNTSDSVARRSYRLDSNSICGYGTPLY
jgi:hypothetical protein